MGFSRQRRLEWVAISFSRDLPDPGIEPASLVSPALAGGFFMAEPPGTCVSIQETRVRSLGREDPTCLRATNPVCAAQPRGLHSRASALQPEKAPQLDIHSATREELLLTPS